MKFGIVGLGKIGSNIALQALEKGLEVVGIDLQRKEFLEKKGMVFTEDISKLRDLLPQPRIVFLWLPAGRAIDNILEQLMSVLENGDIVIDGGNSHYQDSRARYDRLAKEGINFVDCGTSGGIDGARNGACFMVGGDHLAAKTVERIFLTLAVEGGYVYTGKPGTGHLVKLVHNAIEFGMLQSIGEGFSILKHMQPELGLDLQAIFENWSHGSVIRGWLVELMAQGLKENDNLDKINSYVEDTGEVSWMVEDALKMEVPIPVIAQSVMELFKSRQSSNDAAKAIAVMRHGFGGHPFGKADEIAEERQTGRIRH